MESNDRQLRVLNVEDSERDSALLRRHIIAAGYDLLLERVETAELMKSALLDKPWDLILCDYSMPRFSALAALSVLRATEIDVPFIIISGTVGEEIAVKALLSGANDYIPKGNLARLMPAIQRELAQAEARRAKRQADIDRRQSDDRYRALFDYAPDGIIISSPDNYYLDANASMCLMLGYDHQELMGMHASEIVIRSEAQELESEFELVKATPNYSREWHFRRKDGSVFAGEVIATIMPDGNLLAMIRDISERKRAAEAFSEIAREKAESLALIDTILSRAPIGFAFHDRELRYVRINETLAAINGLRVADHIGKTLIEILPHMAPVLEPIMREVIRTGAPVVDFEMSGETQAVPDQSKYWQVSFYPVRMEGGEVLGVGVLVSDVSERKQAEEELQRQRTELRILFDVMPAMIWFKDTENNIIRVNKRVADAAGLSLEEIEGKPAQEIYPDEAAKFYADDLKVLESGKPKLGFEEMLPGSDGGKIWVQTDKVPYFNDDGDPIGIVVMAQDVTVRKHAEEALTESEERYRDLVENATDIIYTQDLEGNYTSINKAGERITGFTREESLSRNLRHAVAPDYRQKAKEMIAAKLKGLEKTAYELEIVAKDGHYVAVEVNTRIIYNEGVPVGVQGIARDISERKAGEAARLASERRYQALFTLAPVGIYQAQPDGSVTTANAALAKMLGYDNSEELLGKNFADIYFDPAELGEPLDKFEDFGFATDVDMRWKQKDGSPIWIQLTAHAIKAPDGTTEYFEGFVRDITESKRAREAIENSERTLKGLATQLESERKRLVDAQTLAKLGSWHTDLVTMNVIWSPETYRIFGTDQNTFSLNHESFLQLVHPDDREAVANAFTDSLDKESEYQITHRILLDDGSIKFVEEHWQIIHDEGKPLRAIGTVLDITERKLADEALRESDEKFHQLADNINDSFWIRSPDLNEIHYISPAFEQIWGRPLENLYETPHQWLNFIVPEDREFVRQAYQRLMGPASKIDIEYRIVRADEEIRWVRTRGFQVRNADGELIRLAGIVSDITESKKAVQALAESEERYRDLVENAIDVIYTLDLNGNYTSMNRAGELLSGYPHDVSLTRNISDSILPEYRDKARQMITAQIAGNDISAFEIEIEDKEGRRIALEVNTRAIKENGVTIGVQGIARDVTERKLADAEIKEKSALLEAQLHSSIDGILIVDGYGKKILHNKQFVDLFKIPHRIAADPDDAQQVKWITGLMKDPDNFVDKVLYLYANPEEVSRDEIELKDGTTLDRYSAPVMGRDDKNYGRIWTFRDITDRKRAEVTLRESELRLRTIIDTEPECVKLLARDGSLLEMNAAGLQMIEADSFEQVANVQVSRLVAEEDRKAFRQLIENVFRGESAVLEFQVNGLKGSLRWLDTHASPLRDASGNITALLGITRDITKQKRSDKERRILFEIIQGAITSRGLDEFLQLAHRSIAQMVYAENFFVSLHDPVTNHFINKFWEDKFDPPPPPHPVGMGFGSYVLRTSKPLMVTSEVEREMIARGDAVLSGTPSASWVGVPLRTSTRTIGIMVLQNYEIENAYDELDLEFLSSVGDQVGLAIERQWAQTLLMDSQERLALAAESVNLGIWDWDVIKNNLEWDERMYELYGIKEEDFSGAYDAWQTGLHPDDREKGDADIQAALTGERPFSNDFRVVWPNGELHYIEARALVERNEDHKALRMVGVNWDITERKLAEIGLRELTTRTEIRERMLTTMLSSMTDFAQIYDREGRLLFANQPLLDMWDLRLEDVVGKTFHELDYPADVAAKLQSQVELVFITKQPVTDETVFTAADGSQGYFEYIFAPAVGPEGAVDFVIGSTRDLTERKGAEERLKASEANLAKSQQIAHLGSWEMDLVQNGKLYESNLRWSDEVFRIFGYQPGEIEVSNKRFFESVHADDRAGVTAAVEEALRSGTEYRLDHRIVMPDGTDRSVHEHGEIVFDESGKPVKMVGTVQDITDRKQLEEQYRQSQKMEAVGVLAGGIAHDFNNLLTAINGYSDLALRKMPPDDPLRNHIEEVRNAGARAAELTTQLLAFSRKQVLKPTILNLNTVIAGLEKMLRRIIRESIELRVVLDPELGNIKGDAGQIEQVIMNLAINARDAMQDGGTLTIESRNVRLEQGHIGQQMSIEPGDFAKITVTDTGEGIPLDVRSRIFEPFFTTKEVGKGTGLGLSTVYGIVKQSGGDIFVYSEPGHGTTFKIYLPCVKEKVQPRKWTGDSPQSYRGTETILVVEDEELVRKLVTEILSDCGYNVLSAPNGPAALEICATYAGPIDMLLTDVIMPRMGGSELKDKVVSIFSDIKVLFMSGYTDDAIAHRGISDTNTAFIEKPFAPDAIARKVREVLES